MNKKFCLLVYFLIFSSFCWAISYNDAIIADGPTAYWRLGESSGSTASSATGNYSGTYTGGVTLGQQGIVTGNNSAYFNGSSSYVGITNNTNLNPNTSSFSISLWIKPQATPFQRFIWKNNGTAPPFDGYYMATYVSQSKLYIYGGFGDAAQSVELSGLGVFNAWNHVVLVRDKSSGKVKLYLNGVIALEKADPTGNIDFTGDLAIGGRPGISQEMFTGNIDEVAIFQKALTAESVTLQYNIGANIPEPSSIMLLGMVAIFMKFLKYFK